VLSTDRQTDSVPVSVNETRVRETEIERLQTPQNSSCYQVELCVRHLVVGEEPSVEENAEGSCAVEDVISCVQL
jgi:hypothetical protein